LNFLLFYIYKTCDVELVSELVKNIEKVLKHTNYYLR